MLPAHQDCGQTWGVHTFSDCDSGRDTGAEAMLEASIESGIAAEKYIQGS